VGIRRQSIHASVLVAAFLFAGLSRDSRATHANTPARAIICEPGQYSVTVTKQGTDPSWVEGTTAHTAVFTIQNGPCTDTYDYTFSATGPITAVTLNKTSSGLTGNASTTVTATYNVDNPGTGQLTLLAVGRVGGASGADYYLVTATIPAGAPVVTPAVPFLEQNYRRCANSCFAALTSRATVPYFSLDAPRQAILIYNSDRGNPRAFVLVDVSPAPGTSPTEYRLRLLLNGTEVRFLNGEDTLRFAYTGTAPVRLGGQFDASSYATNAYRMEVLVTAVLPGGPVTNDYVTRFISVNQVGSPLARGWSFGGVQRLYPQSDGSALVVEGDGSAVYFGKTGTSTFASPAAEFSKLIPSSLSGSSGWARVFPDSTKIVFSSAGLMTRVLDRFGNRDSVVYDASNRVSKLIDPLNLAITMIYDANGLFSIQDPPFRVTWVTVDASKRLTSIRDPDSVATSYGYDGNLRLSTITDRRGFTTTLGYDAQSGTVSSETAPAVPIYGQGTASPVTTFSAWQKLGVPYSATASAPLTPPLADTVQARITDPRGYTTALRVDRFGATRWMLDPVGRVTTFTRDTNSLVVRDSFPSGGVDSMAYNTSGLRTFIQPAGQSPINFRYAAFGQADSIWGTGRVATRHFIGSNGRVDSTRVGGQSITKYTYDARGRVLSTTDPQGHLLSLSAYAGTNGNRSRDSLPGGRITTFLYDGYGRDTAVQRPMSPLQRTQYDAINRPVAFVDGVNANPTVIAYDSLFVRSVRDPKGQVYSFTSNALGWMTQRTDPAGRSDYYQYDPVGDLKRWINRRGDTLSWSYDALRRRTNKSGTNTPADAWTYSTNGRVIALNGATSADTETVYFNVFGQPDSVLTKMAGQTFWRRYRYTTGGLPDSMDVTGGGIAFKSRKYVFNSALGTVTEIRLAGASTGMVVNKDLQDTSVAFPSSDRISQQLYPLHKMTQVSTGAAYNLTIARSVGFDSLGRIGVQVAGTGASGHRYTYDGLKRLLSDSMVNNSSPPSSCDGSPQPTIDAYGNSCVNAGGWSAVSGAQFAYDEVGNRTDHGGTYSTGNRITAFDGCTYTTDFDGNVGSRTCGSSVATFAWSAESRLTSVTIGAQIVAFKYDALGRLVRKDLNGSPQSYFLWDRFHLLAELSSTGTAAVAEYSYYPGFDRLHALVVGGNQYNAHHDATGSVIALTDASQGVQRTYEYDVWGQLTGGSDNRPFNNADRARWKGALWLGPEIDLYYMRNRWYEPKSGRFLSEDPLHLAKVAPAPQGEFLWKAMDIRQALTQPGTGQLSRPNEGPWRHRSSRLAGWRISGRCGGDGTNAYVYAENRPTSDRDPSGLQVDDLACYVCWLAVAIIASACDEIGWPQWCADIVHATVATCIQTCGISPNLGGGGGGGGGGGSGGGGGCGWYDIYVDGVYSGTSWLCVQNEQ
jgi:RHS repeat-associated protein